MAKSIQQPDVLILGDHPSAYLAAGLLGKSGGIRVSHSRIPQERWPDRLVTINPAFFSLHEMLTPLKRKLDLTPIYGLKFLTDDPAVSGTSVNKSIGAYVASFKQIHGLLRKVAENTDVKCYDPKVLQIQKVDEKGLSIEIDKTTLHPKLLILAGELPPEQKRMIGLPAKWDEQVIHQYVYLRLKGAKWHDRGNRPVIPMALDVRGTLNWAWLLPGDGQVQLAVVRSGRNAEGAPSADEMLRHWIKVLTAQGVLHAGGAIDTSQAVTMDLPLGGALSQEGLANRTLLIGPAGGFYSECAEDIYPNCWSAIYAAEIAKRGIKERHLQDAMQPYRQQWGATLGDYLRGPQPNLRFLLPLVYRNPTMAARLADAILTGKSVVR